MALHMVTECAGAAWRYYCHSPVRFAWAPSRVLGPREVLMYIVNGPSFFAHEWRRLFMTEVVKQSRFFSALPTHVLHAILDMAMKM